MVQKFLETDWGTIVKQGKLKRLSMALLATSLFVATSGCGRKAEGQVLAVVNGDEITVDELNAELKVTPLPPTMDKKLAHRFVLQQIVERKLLAQTAIDQGFDRDPAYVIEQRRMNEDLLVEMFAKKAADAISIPDAKAVDAFIAANPIMFDQRTRYALNQVTFDLPSDPARLKILESAQDMATVKAQLASLGIAFQEGTGTMDSGIVDPQTMTKILQNKTEPFIAPAGSKVIVSIIAGEQKTPLTGEQARPFAAQALRAKQLEEIGRTRVTEAKAAAKLQYQTGYEPLSDGKAAAAPAKK
jgi:peptidyl-prolyl cis-trans isomerase C